MHGNTTVKICDSSILITGGTGSFGKAFVSAVLERCPNVRRLVIFSRDELKQFEMRQQFPEDKYPAIRYFLGDVRDKDRLRRALQGVDTVVHAAALKQVPAAAYDPFEFIKTNVIGAQNVIEACLDTDVRRVVALSTDKAAAPINLYGATKLCSDKLFLAANNVKGTRDLRLSVVRYGNVMGSRGSVIPYFINQARRGLISITHKDMTRFNISLEDGVNMVFWGLQNAIGGEIFIPKIPSYRIEDVATAVAPSITPTYIGIRPGEKMHEEMITSNDAGNAWDIGSYYAILGQHMEIALEHYSRGFDYKRLPNDFSYKSDTNPSFLTVQEIRDLIIKHVDNNFRPI